MNIPTTVVPAQFTPTAWPLTPPQRATADNTGTTRLAVDLDGQATLLGFAAGGLVAAANTGPGTPFVAQEIDRSAAGLGNAVVRRGPDGVWALWFVGTATGAEMHLGHRPHGTTRWTVTPIPGSGTANPAAYKVTDLQVSPTGRVYALWGRNTVGARWIARDPGGAPLPAIDVPGDVGRGADFNLGVSSGGVVAVSAFDRASGGLLAALYQDGAWGPVTRISPLGGQAYRGRWAADAAGGLQVLWIQTDPATGVNDLYLRAWTPSGWDPQVVRVHTPGNTAGNGYALSVDHGGVTHLVYSDDAAGGVQQSYYTAGQGAQFSTPQRLDGGAFGGANLRNPDVDAGPGGIHATFNSNVSGAFANYYVLRAGAGAFTDVSTGSIFAPYIRDLVQRGVLTGYADGTFRPGAPLDRGTAATALVRALGLPLDTTGGPHFSDVPADHPDYAALETAYHRGLLGGYADGGARPDAPVTRAQLAKMVAIATGMPRPRPAVPTFTDVAADNLFYAFVEAVAAARLIGGYADGTFRPGRLATREQGAKILSLASATPR